MSAALLPVDDAELIESVSLSGAEFDELESQLAIRATCLGWTGDPMRQPVAVVAATVRGILANRSTSPTG